jgi:uncharacterized protein YkwD
MIWALIASLAIGALPVTLPLLPADALAAAAIDPKSSSYDSEAERQLLVMANQARAQAGLPPLRLDEGLAQAARAHAAALAARQQLSHQLPGEPSLQQRLATSRLHLDLGGENVVFAPSVDQAHQGLMRSTPHRANLLNASYNVAGFGVVRNGYALYVTQDFGHGLPTYSAQTSADIVAASVSRAREEARLPRLQQFDGSAAHAAACSMARENSLNTPLSRQMAQSHYLLRYTSDRPQTLPSSAARAFGDRHVRAFAVGSCYARSASYPNGVYWVALLFY